MQSKSNALPPRRISSNKASRSGASMTRLPSKSKSANSTTQVGVRVGDPLAVGVGPPGVSVGVGVRDGPPGVIVGVKVEVGPPGVFVAVGVDEAVTVGV